MLITSIYICFLVKNQSNPSYLWPRLLHTLNINAPVTSTNSGCLFMIVIVNICQLAAAELARRDDVLLCVVAGGVDGVGGLSSEADITSWHVSFPHSEASVLLLYTTALYTDAITRSLYNKNTSTLATYAKIIVFSKRNPQISPTRMFSGWHAPSGGQPWKRVY